MRIFIIAGLLAASAGAQAQNNLENIMVVSEMTGACRIMKQLIDSEEGYKVARG